MFNSHTKASLKMGGLRHPEYVPKHQYRCWPSIRPSVCQFNDLGQPPSVLNWFSLIKVSGRERVYEWRKQTTPAECHWAVFFAKKTDFSTIMSEFLDTSMLQFNVRMHSTRMAGDIHISLLKLARHTCVTCESYKFVIDGSDTAKLKGVMQSIVKIINDFTLLQQLLV